MPFLLLAASCLTVVAQAAGSANFSANMGSGMVLQRAPAQASLYGFTNANPQSGVARITVTLKSTEGGASPESYTGTVFPDGTWKVLLSAKPAGGSFTASVACTSPGCASAASTTITDLTFGDVWYCTGQSNMELDLIHTFNRNETVAKIANGSYDNIRIYLNPHVYAHSPVYVSNGVASAKAAQHTHYRNGGGAGSSLDWSWTRVKDAVNVSSGDAVQAGGKPPP